MVHFPENRPILPGKKSFPRETALLPGILYQFQRKTVAFNHPKNNSTWQITAANLPGSISNRKFPLLFRNTRL